MAIKRYNNATSSATGDITTIPPNAQSQPTVQQQEPQPLQLPQQPAQQPFAANGLTAQRIPAAVVSAPDVINSPIRQTKPAGQPAVRIAQSDIFNVYKNTPSLTPRQRMAGYAQAMSKNGYDVGYGELADLYGGGETAQDKEKRLRRERNGRIVAALGDLFGNVINYIHTRNGMPAMKIESRFQPTTERQRTMEQYRQALAQKDFANFYAGVSAENKARNAQKLAAMKAAQAAGIAAQKAAAAEKAAAAKQKQAEQAAKDLNDYRQKKLDLEQAAQDSLNEYRKQQIKLGQQRNSIAATNVRNKNTRSGGGGNTSQDYPYSYMYRQLMTDGYGGKKFEDPLGWEDLMSNNKFEYSDDNEKAVRPFFRMNPMIEKMVRKKIQLNNEMGGNYAPYTESE